MARIYRSLLFDKNDHTRSNPPFAVKANKQQVEVTKPRSLRWRWEARIRRTGAIEVTEMTTEAENERIARRVPEEIATEGNIELVEEVYAEDAVDHLPFGNDARGIGQIKEALQIYRTAFPDFTATVNEAVTQGDTVAMRVTLSGTHEGQFMGMEPTNKSFETQNMVFTRIEDGKIVERWVQPDTLGMLVQLGIVSPPSGVSAQS